jgi:hypothetical protein
LTVQKNAAPSGERGGRGEFAQAKIIHQDINRTDVVDFDGQGYLAKNKIFILPGTAKYMLALMISLGGIWFVHAFSGVLFGGLHCRLPSCRLFPSAKPRPSSKRP